MFLICWIEMRTRRLEVRPYTFSSGMNMNAVGSGLQLRDAQVHPHSACRRHERSRPNFVARRIHDVRVSRRGHLYRRPQRYVLRLGLGVRLPADYDSAKNATKD